MFARHRTNLPDIRFGLASLVVSFVRRIAECATEEVIPVPPVGSQAVSGLFPRSPHLALLCTSGRLDGEGVPL